MGYVYYHISINKHYILVPKIPSQCIHKHQVSRDSLCIKQQSVPIRGPKTMYILGGGGGG